MSESGETEFIESTSCSSFPGYVLQTYWHHAGCLNLRLFCLPTKISFIVAFDKNRVE